MAGASALEFDRERPLPGRGTSLSTNRLFFLFALELLGLTAIRLPQTMQFDSFAFCDFGSDLTLEYLVSKGLKPALDFGYHYGLLPIVLGHVWFSTFGATPASYQAATFVCGLLMAFAFAKIVAALRLKGVGLAIVIIGLGFAVEPSYPHLAQALEAVLLCHALAEHTRGARENALALSSAAIFAKPAMGFVYSALLTAIITWRLYRARSGVRAWVEAFAPAAIVVAALCSLLGADFGVSALAGTAFPIGGYANYKAMNYGFFGSGRAFWNPAGVSWLYYVIDFAGFWLAGSMFLFASAAVAARRLRGPADQQPARARDEMIATCAILHASFAIIFFGNQWSWIYYAYLLVIGVAVAVDVSPWSRRIGYVFAVLALFSWTAPAFTMQRLWKTTERSTITAGLWAPPAQRDEWGRVLALARQQRTAILDITGAAELMFPGFIPPATLYLEPGLMMPAEIRAKLAQLDGADTVVVPLGAPPCSGIPKAAEFDSAVAGMNPLWKGDYFAVYQRPAPPAAARLN